MAELAHQDVERLRRKQVDLLSGKRQRVPSVCATVVRVENSTEKLNKAVPQFTFTAFKEVKHDRTNSF